MDKSERWDKTMNTREAVDKIIKYRKPVLYGLMLYILFKILFLELDIYFNEKHKNQTMLWREWEETYVPGEYTIKDLKMENTLFWKRSLSVKYIIEEEKEKVKEYYNKTLINNGWQKEEESKNTITYKKGDRLKLTITHISEKTWDLEFSCIAKTVIMWNNWFK